MKKSILLTLAATICLLAGCHAQSMDDSKITAKIESKLVGDSQTSALKIRVSTTNGVVTLSGTVPSDTEKNEAEKLARATEGVGRVQNELQVNPNAIDTTNFSEKAGEAAKNAGVSDAAIHAKLKAKLLADGITGTDVDVIDGSVLLKGEVGDPQKKAKAEELARNTDGVKAVKNELIVKKGKSS